MSVAKGLQVLLCAVLLSVVTLGVAQAEAPVQSPALLVAKSLSSAFAEVAAHVTPAVVNISSTRVEPGRRLPSSSLFRDFFPEFLDMVEPPREVQSLGSGVILRPDGYIVTNCHVIQGAQENTVKLASEVEYPARLVGQDPFTDLAVIKIDATNLPTVSLGDSTRLRVGEWVIAVGSPLGLAQTVTQGIVSALGRRNIGITDYEDFIQTDAAINPGNSGGALVNLDGELVGINTAIASEGGGYDGVCFAIPSSVVKTVTDALIRDGKIQRPWIGLMSRELRKDQWERLGVAERSGVFVYNLVRNGPAHRAQLQPGDVLLKWGSEPLTGRAKLSELVQKTPIGTKVTVLLKRNGQRYTAEITIGERPANVQMKGLL